MTVDGSLRLGVIGDFDPDRVSHVATNEAIQCAARSLGFHVETAWIPTRLIQQNGDEPLRSYDGFWCAPGTPYQSPNGATYAIRFAREMGRPLLGTCGGCQHVVLEYARNVLGVADAAHAEEEPESTQLFIVPMSCSIIGEEGQVNIVVDSMASHFYGTTTIREQYRCTFEVNPAKLRELQDNGLVASGFDGQGRPRLFELPGRPFYMATLFLPQMGPTPGRPHPLIVAFLRALPKRT